MRKLISKFGRGSLSCLALEEMEYPFLNLHLEKIERLTVVVKEVRRCSKRAHILLLLKLICYKTGVV